MTDLPSEIQVWESYPKLHHTGTWATTRYPAKAVPYVCKADADLAVAEAIRRACLAVSEQADWPEDEHGRTEQSELFARVINAIRALASPSGVEALAALRAEREPFQDRVRPWMLACFGEEVSNDKLERGDRLLEEVLELLQSAQYPKERVAALVGYVWSRPEGEPSQEVGGVMVTLAAYCLAHGLDMHSAAETELARIWTKVEKIRAKQAAKPKGSALPQAWPAERDDALAPADTLAEVRRLRDNLAAEEAAGAAMIRGCRILTDDLKFRAEKAEAEIAHLTYSMGRAASDRDAALERVEKLRQQITEATDPDFIFGAMDNVNDMDVTLDQFAAAASRAIRAAMDEDARHA